MTVPSDPRTVCRADKLARTITFYIRDGFGDGTDGCGNALAVPGAEKDAAVRTFTKAIGIFTGETKSVMDVENWVRMRPYSTPLESSDAKVGHS